MADLAWIAAERRFEYLSKEESEEYALVRDSDDEAHKLIKRLLEKVASASRAAHCASKY